MWDFAPWTPKDWTSPKERIRLVQSRILCNDDPILDPANPKRSCRYYMKTESLRERHREREREREMERQTDRETEREIDR